MPCKEIIVTGAASYIGQRLITAISQNDQFRITAIVSPRCNRISTLAAGDRVNYLQVDLERPLPPAIVNLLSQSDLLLHLAWCRSADREKAVESNTMMVRHILAALGNPRSFVFASSIAAAADAPGVYGYAKFVVAEQVRQAGGINFVIGLTMDDPPKAAFGALSALVRKTPFALRFLDRDLKTYPIDADDLVAAIIRIAASPPSPGTYGAFLPYGISINTLLAGLEKTTPRLRLPVPLAVGPIVGAGRALSHTPLSVLGQKILTFLYKDTHELDSLEIFSELNLSATKARLSRMGIL